MDINTVISIAGASVGVFLSAMFLLQRRHHPSMIVLGIYILFFSLGLLESLHNREQAGVLQNIFFSLIANANLLYGPLIYFFVRYLKEKRIATRVLLVHFSPFIVLFIADILSILGLITIAGTALELIDFVLFEFLVAQLLTYSVISLRMYNRMRRFLLQTYSNINTGDVNWMLVILRAIAATYLLSFAMSHMLLLGLITDRSVFVAIQVMVALITYAFGYRMYTRPSFFDLKFQSNGKYRKSGLKPDQVSEQLQSLLQYMNNNKPFANPELTIFDLASGMQISRNHLTEILNIHVGKNFYEFINFYRVEEAKKLMRDPAFSHLSMAGIGKEAGFKSSAAFFSNFKKLNGCTPGEWKDRPSGFSSALPSVSS